MNKLIWIPLVFLAITALMAQLGLAELSMTAYINQEYDSEWVASADGTFDVSGHMVLNDQGFKIGEFGLAFYQGSQQFWLNTTNSPGIGPGGVDPFSGNTDYPIFNLASGESILSYQPQDLNVNLSNQNLMMIAVVTGVIILAGVAGLKIFGTGESDFSISAIVKGAGYLTVWGILSLASIAIIMGIPIFGIAFYFVLTLAYAVGCIGSFGGASE